MITIIGAGPIGLACGIALKKKDIPFRIIDKGCLVDSVFHYPTNMTFFSTSDRLEIGGVPFISHGMKPTRREALEYYRRVAESYELPLQLYEEVTDIRGEDGAFTVTTDKGTYDSEKVIISSGFYGRPHRMNVPGEDLPKVKHYYDEPHPYAFMKVLVVGAGNSAVDVALESYRCGSQVSMVIREPQIKETVKYWVKPDIENRIREGSIRAWFNSEVIEIREDEADIRTPDGVITIENDYVMAMTGYEPDFELLKRAGITFHGDEQIPWYDEQTQLSNVPGIYLAGVVCGGLNTSKWFIENARVHADMIADDIASADRVSRLSS
ncbi:YpdA family putative bacillithiol disulfide reductase [Natronogracilivirga saccharolytica]|uniref:YpdA family putative bacillithiol disulfide reductase n=1 Tax=Natronogracilivirga saccharolytica TaxID=2812953 RepID=A0A8J7UUB6_9BACT|nr:YpdA family putative bacillithiol disulfide reductase [Natronogracilivirga saccharolytica]MBP3193461.1 YpdA family putative bacillithiol disulfide reductase [Natronogracilivirga saccharolytica]